MSANGLADVVRLMRVLELTGKRTGLDPSKVLEVLSAYSVATAEYDAEVEFNQAAAKTMQPEGRA
jgi:hypothetical protein